MGDVCWKLEVDLGGGSGLGRGVFRVGKGEGEGSDARKRFHACSSYPPPPPRRLGYIRSSAMTQPSV